MGPQIRFDEFAQIVFDIVIVSDANYHASVTSSVFVLFTS